MQAFDTSEAVAPQHPAAPDADLLPLPRLGFLGMGWIGLNRMRWIAKKNNATIQAVADLNVQARTAAKEVVPSAASAETLDELLAMDLDGIVIATPSALHAEQVVQALRSNTAIFCQKPLARTKAEAEEIVAAAETANCLLHVDFCYRTIAGVARAKELIQTGALGKIFLVDLVFHNAYGPDKAWFYDRTLSGGGCLIDLGTHLIDLCQWMLGTAGYSHLTSSLWRAGEPYLHSDNDVEDVALVQWKSQLGSDVRLACSWNLSAGTDAVIGATFYGTQGAVSLNNINGSFYDFLVEQHVGTTRVPLAEVDNDWGGRALHDWIESLRQGNRFDPAVKSVIDVAELLDESYGR